jgi:hypothetical protein
VRSITVEARPEIAAAIVAAIDAVLADEARASVVVEPRTESAWRRAGILEAIAAPMPTTSWRTTN